MTDNPTPQDLPDIKPIHRLIRATLVLLRSSWVATGLGLTIGLLLATLLAAALLDLLAPLWEGFRLAALVAIVAPAVWVFIAGVLRPLFRRLRPGHVARRIEAKLPGIHNRLVSCIDLEANPRAGRTSPEFYRRLVSETLERIKNFRPRAVIDLRNLRRAVVFAGVGVLAFSLAFGLFPDHLRTAMARIFSPFADIPPASGVVYSVVVRPGNTVLRGDDVTFLARVEKGEPERLRLELRGDKAAEPIWYDLQKGDHATWRLTLGGVGIDPERGGVRRSFEYRVHGGGTWTKVDRVAIVDRPMIVGLHTVLHYPDYMGLPEPRVGPPQVADLTGPEGSTAEVVVQAEGDVAIGEIQRLKPQVRRIENKERPERVWFAEKVPEGAAIGGNWQWDFRLLGRMAHTEPPSAGPHGHQFHSAPVGFRVQPGEDLFAMVFIKPDQKPETIMLQWHDGAGWEHRAYWGEDKIPQGQPNTPSRYHAGPLPPTGEWVRLEVPASAVGLDGRTLRGMDFSLFGGQCVWGRTGTIPPSHREEQDLVVASTLPMKSAGQGRWSGRLPIDRDELYRVELRNELGYANKTMRRAKVVALPDNPPQVVLERPGTDLVLSEPAKVPLSIAAFDDFGLADIVVAVQRGDNGGFVGRPLKHYNVPKRSDNVVTSLDLAAIQPTLKAGEHVRYRVEARDRKGQSAQTQEYVVRIAADNNAADKVLASFEQSQDTFRENLVKLIAEQGKVREAVEKVAAKYDSLDEKVQEARDREAARQKPGEAPKAEASKVPELDPETRARLDEVRKELAQLAPKEDQNVQLGNQVAAELAKAAEQAANLQMLPPQVANPLKEAQAAFRDLALKPLENLAGELKQGADPAQNAPNLEQLKEKSDRLQKELEAMKERLDALAKARKEMQTDADDALARLKREMLRQDAGLTARDMEDLLAFLKARATELERLKVDQAQLAEATPKVPELLLPDVERKQGELEAQAERELADARRLLDAEAQRKMRRRDPDFPDAPYAPDAKEEFVPPKEEDTDEPEAKKDGEAKKKGEVTKKDDAGDDDPELFMPALGGPKPKLDPRFADKIRHAEAKAKGDHNPESRRERLESRQDQKLAEISTARESLASDHQTLAEIMKQLQAALDANDAEGTQRQLDRLMESAGMKQALAMAARMQQIRAGRNSPHPPQPGTPPPGLATTTSPRLDAGGPPTASVLAELDLNTRTMILKMQPQLREELLQGLREEGPEGYRKFIQDYFRRLSQVKGPQ